MKMPWQLFVAPCLNWIPRVSLQLRGTFPEDFQTDGSTLVLAVHIELTPWSFTNNNHFNHHLTGPNELKETSQIARKIF